MRRPAIIAVVVLLTAALPVASAEALGPSTLTQLPDPDDCVANTSPAGAPACKPADGLTLPGGGAISPDGKSVYVPASSIVGMSTETGMIAEFSRSTASGPSHGALTQLALPNNCVSRDPDGAGPNPPDNPACSGITGSGIPSQSVGQIFNLAVSPDGKNVYATSRGPGTLLVFNRSTTPGPSFGALTYAGCASAGGANGCLTQAAGLQGAQDVVVSHDGENVYVAADGLGSNTPNVVALNRDKTTGAVSFANCLIESTFTQSGCTPAGRAIINLHSIAISPDDQTVYVAAADTGNGVAAFSRDPSSTPAGKLAQIAGAGGCVTETGLDHAGNGTPNACIDGRGLNGALDVAVSADGKQVYAAATGTTNPTNQGTVAILARATSGTVGALSQANAAAGCLSNDVDGPGGNPPVNPDCGGATAIAGAGGIAGTGDGKSVYVLGGTNAAGTVAIFDRDGGTGGLTQALGSDACLVSNNVVSPCAPVTGLRVPTGIWVSDDGQNVYVSTFIDRSVVELLRGATAAGPGPGGGPPAAGGGPPPSGGGVPQASLALSGLSMLRRRFAVARTPTAKVAARRKVKRGTVFRFTLSAAATLTIRLDRALPGRRSRGKCRKPTARLRRARKCTRYVTAGTLTRKGLKAGRRSVAFSGRVGRRALAAGRYRATLRAKDAAGLATRSRSVTFTVVAG
jgi:DNA-binding beta-propeller fold protein YncE